MSRGRYLRQDQTQALGLIKMAVENAAPQDRIWIEDIYQNIYCNSNKDVREKSKGLVANWKKMFAQPRTAVEQPMGLGRRADTMPTRVCSNGERLDINALDGKTQPTPPVGSTAAPTMGLVPAPVKQPVR
jgi:uncharacterized protein